ncbi:MFS transporter [Kribbella orskensis]|uniref:MFS transporter n=1 Tax=Kribbella orskensis TaxID=2512216 RepID=A0ABY2BEF4_9ACTN|nr:MULTISPECIES: MFS transporter [Kribbella]TCN36650.1 MFS transporter [Kribbella sp. VKM Ac-2500]TCO17889.1 MFS transporter [Kribbella orskensis]
MVGVLLVLRLVPGRQSAGSTSALAELKVFRDREVQLAIAITAVANIGLLTVFTFFAPLMTEVTGFAADTVTILLLVYGVGATVGNLVGGRLADRVLVKSQLGLLALLVITLVLMWVASGSLVITAVLVFVVGAVGFSVIPGMQLRVLTTATAAPTLAIAVNASAYQLAAAAAGWLGGQFIGGSLGARAIYLAAAAVTLAGLGLTAYASSNARQRRAVSLFIG